MAPVTPAVDASGRRRPAAAAHPIVPGLDELIDALALLALTMIGIVGFRPAYGGHGYLAVGAVGIIGGLLLSHAGQRARLPLAAVLAASALAFLLFGCVDQPARGGVSADAPGGHERGRLRLAAAAHHGPARRQDRQPARAALPARPLQRGGRARAGAAHGDGAAARRRARSRRRAVHPVRRPEAGRRRAPGGGLRRRRPGLGGGPPGARRRPGRSPSAGSGPGSGSARARSCSPWPARAPSSSARTCRARARTSGSCSPSCRRSTSASSRPRSPPTATTPRTRRRR